MDDKELEADMDASNQGENESSLKSDLFVCSDDSDSSSGSSCSSLNRDPTRAEFFDALQLKPSPCEGAKQDLDVDSFSESKTDQSESTENSDEHLLISSETTATSSEARIDEKSALLSDSMEGSLDPENLNNRTDKNTSDFKKRDSAANVNTNELSPISEIEKSRKRFNIKNFTNLAKQIDHSFDMTRITPLRHISDIPANQAARRTAEDIPVYDNLYDLVRYYGKPECSELPCKESLGAIDPDFLFHWHTFYKEIREKDILKRDVLKREIQFKWNSDCISQFLKSLHVISENLKQMPQNTIEEVSNVNLNCLAAISNLQESIVSACIRFCKAQEKFLDYHQHTVEMECETVQLLDKKLVEKDTNIQGQHLGEWYISKYYDLRNPSYRTTGPNFDNLLDLCTHFAENEYTDDVTRDDVRKRMFDCGYLHYLHVDYARTKKNRNFNLDVYFAGICESMRVFDETMSICNARSPKWNVVNTPKKNDEMDEETLNEDLSTIVDEIYESLAKLCLKVSIIEKKFSRFRAKSHESQEAMMDFMRTRLRMPENLPSIAN